MSYAIVGLVDPPTRIAICVSEDAAAEFIGTLPDNEDGRYYIDVCTDTVVLLREEEE